ncbi:MAG: molybdopterin-dependent oxidoreductase [Phycisphaerae bacterium]|nr:molybdopterin-dependent oxidoreductase [Phycisphaerae bacterium]
MSPKTTRTRTMEINHREVSFPEGATVLRAAELNDIYIPSLCSHKDLTPFGGCRLCIVEIEGMRGYPLSCSTVATEGMKVLTDTATLREMRNEILQLILSEHPSSCLVCDEKDECRQNQYTIRKAGVTTGCRYCPNDGQCELQDVVEKIGVTEIEYPIYYRGYEVEHDDPFFDRDYNICILCGRCVRMCQEVRGTSVLAFKYRGPRVQVGPAFGKSHVEAGCEFCGACISVCPTGSLADKGSKWDGQPDGAEVSTCPFCGIGCQVELHHKDGRLSKVHPHLDAEINDGQLCVRGRFCMPEATHHHQRAKKPMLRRGKYFREVTWEESIDEVAGKLKGLKPDDFLMVASGDLTNEGLFTAQQFVRTCLKSNSIDSTARDSLPGGLGLWARLFSLPISVKGLRQADAIIAVGLDSRFYFSIVGVEIRHALKAGAKLVTIDPRDSNLARYTNTWLRPTPGKEGALLNAIARRIDRRPTHVCGTGVSPVSPPPGRRCHKDVGMGSEKKGGFKDLAGRTGIDADSLEDAVNSLSSGDNLAVVIGPTVFEYDANEELIEALEELAGRRNTTFMPLYNGANTRGVLELGAMGEIFPGVAKAKGEGISLADVIEGRAKPKVIYLVGEAPFFERPDCEYLIAQNTYYPPFAVDAFLPAASFAEAEGTLTNVEGRVQQLVQIEALPDGAVMGLARPDWFIFSRLAEKLRCPELKYTSAKAVLKGINRQVPGFPARPDRRPRRLAPKAKLPVEKRKAGPAGTGPYLLVAEPAGFGHRGMDLSSKVEGLNELALEEGFRLNPEDLRTLRVKPGERVEVSIGKRTVTGPARADAECPQGSVYFHRPTSCGGIEHRANLEPLYRLRKSPVRVEVRTAERTGKEAKKKAAPKKVPTAER